MFFYCLVRETPRELRRLINLRANNLFIYKINNKNNKKKFGVDSFSIVDKSISLVESKSRSRSVLLTADMSYRTNDLPAISRHLSESPPPLSKYFIPFKINQIFYSHLLHSSRQNYEDLVSCSICYEVYDNVNQLKAPKILPCQHTYCVECIKNLVNVSTERQAFCCPQCKFKVTNLSDPTTLPTSRIVLSLLEKESFNYQGFASCPSCRQVRNLEVCFECNLPLCNQVNFMLKYSPDSNII